jgi:hypothetical protein
MAIEQIKVRRDTAANWTSNNPTLAAGEIGFETDTGRFKIGTGSTAWTSRSYAAPAINAVVDHAALTTSVHGIENTANLVVTSDLALLAPLAGPTFSGTVSLPSTTSIGDVSSTEIAYVNGVTSAIQTQLDGKLASSTASATYAALSGPTFTGTVVLPSTTSIGDISSAELGHVNGVTSAIQTQIDAKAPLANPTFTGTVAGITKSMVGLGSVNDTADADKPVSTATQTALDAKLSLAGGTMTGKITLDGDPSSALHAATKQYVDNTASGIVAKPQVLGATTLNIDATYNNGTAGVGATLTHNSNGEFPSSAGGASGWAVGKGILVKNQTNKAQNGRYYISNMGSASTPYVLTRCSYCDEASEIPGAYIFVQDGTSAGTGWIQVVEDPATFVVGTDNIDVFQFSGSGTITAGTNVSVSGNEVSVVAAPTFSGLVTASASGVAFSDGTQTKIGVPSITTISQKTDSYTLSNLNERDSIIEISKGSATTLTIPADSTVNYPVGTTLDVIQTSSGQVTIAGAGGVTVNATPGLKLRTQWSSATLLKRASNTWLVFGDLSA